mgnify:CR=1 FL=1
MGKIEDPKLSRFIAEISLEKLGEKEEQSKKNEKDDLELKNFIANLSLENLGEKEECQKGD